MSECNRRTKQETRTEEDNTLTQLTGTGTKPQIGESTPTEARDVDDRTTA